MTDTDDLRAWAESFVASESVPDRVNVFVDQVYEAVTAQVPEVDADAALSLLTRETIESHWRSFLTTLKDPQKDVPLVEAAADLAKDLARRNYPLTVLFQLYRLAQREVWRYVTAIAVAESDPEIDGTELLVFLWDRVSRWLDSSVAASADLFQQERERIRHTTDAEKLDTVRAILADRAPEYRDIVDRLDGYPISGYNTAVVLHTDTYREVASLHAAVTMLGQALAVRHPLVVNPGGRDLWCWFGTRSLPDTDALRPCESWLEEQQITASVGTPATGVEGFRLSHHEAQQAEKLAFRAHRQPSLTLYADVELLCLVSASPDAADRFVSRTLGALADPGEGPTRLRQTLHTLLRSGSVDKAARALSVHKNTVRYRTAQAEELLGYPTSRAPTEVALALEYHAMFPQGPASS